MAKKEKSNNSSRSWIFFLIAVVGFGGWWLWENKDIKDTIIGYVENSDLLTLESRFTPDQLMESHRKDLIGSNPRTFQEPVYKYYPYLLLEVKYTEDKKSREGVILWGMQDGEMVLNTTTWETTHGFADCLSCQADRNDFKIIQALSQSGTSSIESLQKDLQIEKDVLENWIDSAKKKHLVVQKGSQLQLHFENPKITFIPQTRLKQHLVSKPIGLGQKVSEMYSRNEIIRMAKAAFGSDFTIRKEQKIFLPVYTLIVRNPDESLHISDWNAVTGQRIAVPYLGQK